MHREDVHPTESQTFTNEGELGLRILAELNTLAHGSNDVCFSQELVCDALSRTHPAENQFERFREFWELFSRVESVGSLTDSKKHCTEDLREQADRSATSPALAVVQAAGNTMTPVAPVLQLSSEGLPLSVSLSLSIVTNKGHPSQIS